MKFRQIYLPVFLLICAVIFLLAACGPNLSDEIVQANAQVETVKAENERLSTQVADLQATQAYLAPRMKEMQDALGYFATQIAQPVVVTQVVNVTQVVVSPTPFSEVSGTVVLEGGRCCAGSITGKTITITAAFIASSQHGDVVEMRVASGTTQLDEAGMAQIPWEPYAQVKTFPVEVLSGWMGFWVQVQFRDSEGNISPIYADDISVEGMPPSLTPTP